MAIPFKTLSIFSSKHQLVGQFFFQRHHHSVSAGVVMVTSLRDLNGMCTEELVDHEETEVRAHIYSFVYNKINFPVCLLCVFLQIIQILEPS